MDSRRRRVIWTDPALDHVDQTVAYIAADSVEAARRLLSSVLSAAASLETLSERGRIVPELNDSRVRELFVGRYRLIYAVEDETVTLLALLHGARDLRRALPPGFAS